MHQVKDIVNVAAQLMAADIPALGRELQTQLNFGRALDGLLTEKCDAYVVLAEKLLDAVDRRYKKQTNDLTEALDQLLNQAVHLGGVEASACEGFASASAALGRTTQETQDMRVRLLNKLGIADPPTWTPPE